MGQKLEAINGIETTNPGYIRRHKCFGLKQKKGELTSEFSDRLKLEFVESDMISETVWAFHEYKVVDTLNSDIPDEKELKTRLLKELKKIPNPNQKDCDKFIKIIREHE